MDSIKIIAENRRAHHDYFIEETYECGISLVGTEVKSLRSNHCNLNGAFAIIRDMEIYVEGMQIPLYEKGNLFNHDPLRERKLLLHKKQIRNLFKKAEERGYTLIPTKVYFAKGKVKLELAVAKGKKLYDKREVLAKKDANLEMARNLKAKNR